VLELYLNDDAAWHMAADGTYEQKPTQGKPIRAQHTLMKRWRGGLQSRNSQPTGQPD
jgi:hypothetical protein